MLGHLEKVIVGVSTFHSLNSLMQQTSGYQYTSQAKAINARGTYRNPDQSYDTIYCCFSLSFSILFSRPEEPSVDMEI